MRLINILFFYILCSLLSFAGEYFEEIEEINSKGYITVAMTKNDQSPFFFIDENENKEEDRFKGLDVELAKEIADKLGVKVVFNRESETFNDVVDKVENGEADIAISKLSRTLKRAKRVYFTRPYIELRQGILINRFELAEQGKDESRIGVKDFIETYKGKIGVIESSSYVSFAKEFFPNAEVIEFESWEKVIDAVRKNEIGIAYRDEMEIKKIMKGNPEAILNLKTVIISDIFDDIAIAVNKDKGNLRDFINIFLEKKRLRIDVNELLDKYPEIIK